MASVPLVENRSEILQDNRLVAAQVRAAGSSFYWAMRLQPRPKRAGLFAIYAFCREVDDIADGDAGVADPLAALEDWDNTISALYQGKATRPLERALVRAIDTYQLEKKDFLAVIDGMKADATGPIIAPTWEELSHYCDCVASAVGRLCIHVFGDMSDAARQLATEQGQALQLTNILRDIEEDAALGRIYVPQEILQTHGLAGAAPVELANSPALPAIRAEIGAATQARYTAAEEAAAHCDPVAIRPAMIMMDAYKQKFDAWASNAWYPPRSNPIIKLHRRMSLMGKAAMLWVRS